MRLKRNKAKATWQEGIGDIRFRPGNQTAYLETNVGEGEDLSYLAEIDPKTGHLQKLESDPLGRVDIARAAFSEATDELVGTVYLDDRKRNYWRDEGFAADFKYLRDQFSGREVGLADMSGDDRRWVILTTADTDPGTYHLFDRDSRSLVKFGELRPDFPQDRLSPMTPIRYASSDGWIS